MSSLSVVTTRQELFCKLPTGGLLSVNEGVPITDALEHASCLLACVNSLSASIGDGNAEPVDAYAIQYLNELAKGLIDACVSGALRKEASQ
ncbi:DUF3077 domain-containing protein [Pseudomonas segetis]|uniref:DUF3077 domain-containing protein n=1 Tax=Pseudomonas segetis TaxID=298908 RepID=A0A238Z6G0_9PSED|nr:DUF3077 domain-containing protein [Pseudomonas segetis]SNR79007.1 Protein of unknown function [Pseudomonas segetis]